jgi:hypothetical protein
MMRFSVSLFLLLIVACGGDSVAPPVERGVKIIQGAGITDTATAVFRSGLIIEVHDTSGARAPAGTIVRFDGTNAFVAQPRDTAFSSFVSGSVDASGRVVVSVQLGSYTGSGIIAITVPTLGIVDTARYTIRPGLPASVIPTPSDTLVVVGGSFRYHGTVRDSHGNGRDDPVTWSVDPAATVTSDGTLTVPATGVYHITATATIGGVVRSGTAQVSAVPKTRLAALRNYAVVMMDFDGGNSRVVAPVGDGYFISNTQWMPTRDAIVYSALVDSIQRLYITDTLGVSRPFLTPAPPNVSNQTEPRVAAGGQWVIFGAQDTTRCTAYCLYRARIDGTDAELLSSAVSGLDPAFAPSPDGSRIAVSFGSDVRVFDVATRTLSSWVLSSASMPAWSPDGTKIAVIQQGRLALITPDGVLIRTVGTPFTLDPRPNEWLTWLSDSRFVLTRVRGEFLWVLIDTQTGDVIALPLLPASAIGISIR